MSVLKKKSWNPTKNAWKWVEKLYKKLGQSRLRLLQGADEAAPMKKWTSGCPLQKIQTFLKLRPRLCGFENLGRLSQKRAIATSWNAKVFRSGSHFAVVMNFCWLTCDLILVTRQSWQRTLNVHPARPPLVEEFSGRFLEGVTWHNVNDIHKMNAAFVIVSGALCWYKLKMKSQQCEVLWVQQPCNTRKCYDPLKADRWHQCCLEVEN